MLQITIPSCEKYDSTNNLFINSPSITLSLEHSLVSISKWESKWNKPFLGKSNKSSEEIIDYIRCMTLTQNVPWDAYYSIPSNIINAIADYIDSPMTATTFNNEEKKTANNKIVTSELIYYWMISFGIPFECQKWHLNRLLTLIKVCQIKSQTPKKMSPNEIRSRNRDLNRARRAALNSKG